MPPELLPTLKPIHVGLALLSGAGFVLRGGWMLADSPRLRARPVRVAPHVVDTLLLLSGLLLAAGHRLSPLAAPWLGVKLVLLVVYIGLGMIALRPGPSRGVRAAAFLGAVLVFLWILATAWTRQPLPGW
jgi:uncharacterized membrane protein SirB2